MGPSMALLSFYPGPAARELRELAPAVDLSKRSAGRGRQLFEAQTTFLKARGERVKTALFNLPFQISIPIIPQVPTKEKLKRI